jgi:hypothetical protein
VNILRLEVLTLVGVSALLLAILKGSRALLPFENVTNPPNKKTLIAALIPVICAAVSGATFELAIPWYRAFTNYNVPSYPWLLRVGMFLCGVAPWFVGIYCAFVVSRTANRALRAVGIVELVACVGVGLSLTIAFTVGLG